MNRADVILATLDRHLNSRVELALFGRAALALGFDAAPVEFGQSLDVDGVLWEGQAEELLRSTNFREALDATNRTLDARGLHISHLFDESQLILTPEWRDRRIALSGEWRRLILFRLGDEDLFLTKLMRFDPADLNDARFIARQAGWSRGEAASILRRSRVPDIPEIREQFTLCSREFS